ncbi:MAG: methylated-DNA--[protein]-cysteine S-methyltransferase [Bacteroidota bacterium]
MQTQSHQYRVVAAAIRYLQTHRERQPSLEETARHVHLSKYHLQRLFRDWVGLSPKQFLQHLTVEQAKTLLVRGQTTLATAHDVGLTGTGRLHDHFVRCTAVTPGEFKRGGQEMNIAWQMIESPFGVAAVAETARGICWIAFCGPTTDPLAELRREFPDATLTPGTGPYGQQLACYFQDWRAPEQPLRVYLRGTPFQVQVWKALLAVPAGQLVSYADLANRINRPRAVRAVGTAVGKNPLAYLIPCHRVIRANGLSGQYRWGAERKRLINAYESATL